MQNARNDFDDFHTFCTSFLSNVIGKQAYNKRVLQDTISTIATVSDEAFVVLCLENSLGRWEQEAREPKEKRIDAVYTASPAEASKYGGWSIEGMRRFNTLQKEIIPEMRSKTAQLEADYILHLKGIKLPSRKVKKAKLLANQDDLPWSEFMNDDDDDNYASTSQDEESSGPTNNEDDEERACDQDELNMAQNKKIVGV